MLQAQSLCNQKWKIKTLKGQYLAVLQGEVGLTLAPDNNPVEWTFKPSREFGRYYIEHVQSGERLVDVVNGGFDQWSLEREYNGCFAFIGQGGVFRHFDFNIEAQSDRCLAESQSVLFNKGKRRRLPALSQCEQCQKRLAEYCHWLIEPGSA